MSCTDLPLLKLTYANTVLGASVVDWYPSNKRATEINQSHAFRGASAILDGRYPAPLANHVFELYFEETTVRAYHRTLFKFMGTFVNSAPQSVKLLELVTNTPYADLFDCYMLPPEPKDPSGVLWHSAGIIKVEFQGTQIATIF